MAFIFIIIVVLIGVGIVFGGDKLPDDPFFDDYTEHGEYDGDRKG